MTDHHPDAEAVAYGIAAYVEKHPDAHNWSPRRWAYEAVQVILNDEGAGYEVLSVLEGRSAYDLAVVRVGDVPPWMEDGFCDNCGCEYGDSGLGKFDRPLYVIKEQT
jgi:hypothetical protein